MNWTCNVCSDSFPAEELSAHFRQLHPRFGILQWETTPVVYDESDR